MTVRGIKLRASHGRLPEAVLAQHCLTLSVACLHVQLAQLVMLLAVERACQLVVAMSSSRRASQFSRGVLTSPH